MGFEKGHIKAGGRAKGTENQTTKETREVLHLIISAELVNLPGYIAAITSPAVKAKLLIDLLPFVIPKLNSVKADVTTDKDWTAYYNLSKLTDEELNTMIEIQEKCGTDNGQNQPVIINWSGKK
jgi:hypothetical protein